MDFIQKIIEDGKEKVIPSRIQLEIAYGCNADCIMCPVHINSDRKKGIMDFDLFRKTVDQLEPYKEKIDKVDLWGLGEPLLDKGLFKKIKYMKDKGFRNLAIATNSDLMDEKKQDMLLSSGLDTVIFSIDGVKAETHSAIRRNLNFNNLLKNTMSLIKKRDKGSYQTRFVFRFIRQEINKNEWKSFKSFWDNIVSKQKNDMIIGYDVHSWGGEIKTGVDHDKENPEIAQMPCHHIWDRLMVLRDGKIPLCCSDMHHADYSYGNVADKSPIEIFNNSRIAAIRELHKKGKKNEMDICKKCTILHSELAQEVLD